MLPSHIPRHRIEIPVVFKARFELERVELHFLLRSGARSDRLPNFRLFSVYEVTCLCGHEVAVVRDRDEGDGAGGPGIRITKRVAEVLHAVGSELVLVGDDNVKMRVILVTFCSRRRAH